VRFWLWISVLTASLAALLIDNTPNAAAENIRRLSFVAGMARDGQCQADVVEAQRRNAPALSLCEAAVVEFSETPGTAWSGDRYARNWAGWEFAAEDGQMPASSMREALSLDSQPAPPADQTPIGAKVPEPATMILLGAGMITVSRVARTKRQPPTLSRNQLKKNQQGVLNNSRTPVAMCSPDGDRSASAA